MNKDTILLITSDASLLKWRSLPSKKRAILKELADIEGSNFELVIERHAVIPEVVNGRITHVWMDALRATYADDQRFVGFHMSDKQRKAWGITPRLYGSAHDDFDLVEEFWLSADEKEKREGRDAFIQRFLHEFRHALKRGSNQVDDTHAVHADGDIRGSFKGLRMADFNPGQSIITRLTNLYIDMTTRLPKPLHPIAGAYRVTQRYGVQNALYKRTGRHIGTDYAISVGTPLRAPLDGLVTTAGKHPELGNYCHFEYVLRGQKYEERWCHLFSLPRIGFHRRGDTVAFSGNTGMSTGPHLHREVWKDDVRTDLITKANWSSLTVDPELIK